MAATRAQYNNMNNSSDSSSGSGSESPGWNKVENHKKKNNSFATGGGGNNGGRGQQGQRVQVASNPRPAAAVLPTKDIKDGDPLSICIPRAFKNTSSQRVFETFRRLNFGFIDGVDVVPKTAENGEEFVRVFVHFTKWNYSNPDAKKFREQFVKGEQVNI